MPITRTPRDVQTIVERQVGKWALESKPKAKQEPDVHWPLVTVSREFGTQGAEMGRVVSERLGFSYWDQELVAAIAEETGAQETLLNSLDEKARSRLDDFIREAVGGTAGTVGEYVRQVARISGVLKNHGAAVVIGRGLQFILDPQDILRVRVIGPEGQRVASLAERQGVSAREADRIVRQVERDRQSFIRRHYSVEVGDAIHYDLVINTAFFSVEQAATVVVAAYEAKFGRRPE
jgi:cytidylate kinase